MSSPTVNASTNICTIWPLDSENEFGAQVFGEPYTLKVCIDTGSKMKYSNRGYETVPKDVFYFQYFDGHPKKNDYVKKGDHTSIPDPVDAGADIIREAEIQDCSFLGEIDDVMLIA